MARREVLVIIKERPAKKEPEAPKKPSVWARINEIFSLVLSLTGKVCVVLATAVLLYLAIGEAFSTNLAIDKIQISPRLTEMGYDEQFFITTFVDSMRAIKAFAITGGSKGGAGIRSVTDPLAVDAPHKRGEIKAEVMGTGLSFSQVLDITMKLFGVEKRSINCDVVCSGQKLTGYLRVYSLPTQRVIWKEGNDYERAMGNIINETALASLTFSDPATAALYHHGKSDYDRAIAAARRLLLVNPKEKWAFNFVGRTFNEKALATKDKVYFDSARHALEQAIAIDDRFVSAYNNLGISYLYKQGEESTETALSMFLKAMDADVEKTYPYASFNAARMYSRQRKYDDAIRCNKMSIAIDSGYVPAYNNLAYVYRLRGGENAVFLDSSLSVLEKGFEVAHNRKDTAQLWSTKAETLFYKQGRQAFYDALEQAIERGHKVQERDYKEEPYLSVKDEERFKDMVAPKTSVKIKSTSPTPNAL